MKNLVTGEGFISIDEWIWSISENFTGNYDQIQSYTVPRKFFKELDDFIIAQRLCKVCKDINDGLGYKAMMNFVAATHEDEDEQVSISITFERPAV